MDLGSWLILGYLDIALTLYIAIRVADKDDYKGYYDYEQYLEAMYTFSISLTWFITIPVFYLIKILKK